MSALRKRSLPDVADNVEEDQDECSKIGGWKARESGQEHNMIADEQLTEEALSNIARVLGHATNRPQCDIELSDKDEGDEDNTEPGTVDTAEGLEGQFFEGVALNLPSTTEANVAQADGQPGEKG